MPQVFTVNTQKFQTNKITKLQLKFKIKKGNKRCQGTRIAEQAKITNEENKIKNPQFSSPELI
jgi:hypothetical protein